MDSSDRSKKDKLLLPEPSESVIPQWLSLEFPFDKEDTLNLSNVNTWVNNLHPLSAEEKKQLESEVKYRQVSFLQWKLEVPPQLTDAYYANLLQKNLGKTLALAIRCFNHNNLFADINRDSGLPFMRQDKPKRISTEASREQDEKVRRVVCQAIESGRLEAVDVVLAYFEDWCCVRFAESREMYTKESLLAGVYTQERLTDYEAYLLENCGYTYDQIPEIRKSIDDYQFKLRDQRLLASQLRQAIYYFYPPSKDFLIQNEGVEMRYFPWDKLVSRLSGSGMETKQAFITLGIPPTDNPRAIRTAYRASLIKAHPDHGGSRQKLEQVRKAYGSALCFANAALVDQSFFSSK